MALRSQPLAMGLKQITGLADAVDAKDAVNKGQLDAAIASAVPDGSVTNAKLANMAANTIKANLSDSAATPSDVSLSVLLDDAVSNAQGSLLYRGASAWTALAPGTSGQFLKTLGAAANPAWDAITIPAQPWTLLKKTADQSVANSAAYVNDTELQFPMAASKTYAFRAAIAIAAGAGGFSIAVNGPASPTKIRANVASGAATFTAYNTQITNVTAGGTFIVNLQGVIVNGSNSGTFAVRISQWASNAAATVFEKGSWLEYSEIA